MKKRISWNRDLFIEKAKEVHSDAYDYSKLEYKTSNDVVEIICHRHGEPFLFTPRAADHLRGSGCPKCFNEQRSEKVRLGKGRDQAWFLSKAAEVHKGRYDLSAAQFQGYHSKLIVSCPEHGAWEPLAGNFLKGAGCPTCARKLVGQKVTLSTDDFITKSKLVHGEKFDYSVTQYEKAHSKVDIICPQHGVFSQTAMNHVQGHGCQTCSCQDSQPVKDIKTLLESRNLIVQTEKKLSTNHRLDLFLPDLNIGIEYNGLYWHSDEYRHPRYHLEKSEQAAKEGIHLIHIFEDDWLFSKERTTTWLLAQVCPTEKNWNARQLTAQSESWVNVKEFISSRHIQGTPSAAEYCYTLRTKEGRLVSAMLLSSKNRPQGQVDLERFCSEGRVRGGFSKLLKAFIRDHSHKFSTVVSFSDRSWSKGTVYALNGFVKTGQTPPRYFWVKGQRRFNRRAFQKKFLEKKFENFDWNLSEDENCRKNGYAKIYDCGLDRWELDISRLSSTK